jgi:Reverse transcriptase (RNA-dependent DNA polymerase)
MYTEMFQAAEEEGVRCLTELCNTVVKERKIPEDWKHSLLIPVYKGKGDPLECGSYRAIKLLEHGMKVVERVLENRIREQVSIDEMQFGFTPSKETTDTIFIVRQIQEKFRAKKQEAVYCAVVDLEKAYDRVPREVVKWTLRRVGVEEWLVNTILYMYNGAQTSVRTGDGLGEWFEVLVGLRQGSALSPLLFIIVMDIVSKEIKEGLPWELLNADDLVLMAQSENDIKEKLRKWKGTLESKGMKVNIEKTKVLWKNSDNQKESSAKLPCAVCNKGVGSNSVMCIRDYLM